MYLWPEEFLASQQPNGIVHDLTYLLERTPFVDNPNILQIRDLLRTPRGYLSDKKWWMLTRNGTFL